MNADLRRLVDAPAGTRLRLIHAMAKAWAEKQGTPGKDVEYGWLTATLALAIIELDIMERHDDRAA